MFITFSFSTDGYHFVIEKIKTKTLSGELPERATRRASVEVDRCAVITAREAKRQNREGTQKKREDVPQVCVSHVRLAQTAGRRMI